MALFSDAGIQFLFRWIHFLSGITWIGLLYYFNFVQGPFMAEADAATKSGATQKLVPRALWWFRWSAAVTFLSGVVILGLRRASWSDPWGLTILTGAAFGTVMLANVWRVIWPNQKVVIANAVAVAGGAQANPAAAGAGWWMSRCCGRRCRCIRCGTRRCCTCTPTSSRAGSWSGTGS